MKKLLILIIAVCLMGCVKTPQNELLTEPTHKIEFTVSENATMEYGINEHSNFIFYPYGFQETLHLKKLDTLFLSVELSDYWVITEIYQDDTLKSTTKGYGYRNKFIVR